jgi:hypothetical protein
VWVEHGAREDSDPLKMLPSGSPWATQASWQKGLLRPHPVACQACRRGVGPAALAAMGLILFEQLAAPTSGKHWTLTTLRDRLIKIGAKVVHHARRVVFQMA